MNPVVAIDASLMLTQAIGTSDLGFIKLNGLFRKKEFLDAIEADPETLTVILKSLVEGNILQASDTMAQHGIRLVIENTEKGLRREYYFFQDTEKNFRFYEYPGQAGQNPEIKNFSVEDMALEMYHSITAEDASISFVKALE